MAYKMWLTGESLQLEEASGEILVWAPALGGIPLWEQKVSLFAQGFPNSSLGGSSPSTAAPHPQILRVGAASGTASQSEYYAFSTAEFRELLHFRLYNTLYNTASNAFFV